MIELGNGILLNKKDSYAIIMVGGLGLRVNMSVYGLQTLPNEGGKVQISTYLHVREDILDLYGFSDVVERNTFHLQRIQRERWFRNQTSTGRRNRSSFY